MCCDSIEESLDVMPNWVGERRPINKGILTKVIILLGGINNVVDKQRWEDWNKDVRVSFLELSMESNKLGIRSILVSCIMVSVLIQIGLLKCISEYGKSQLWAFLGSS